MKACGGEFHPHVLVFEIDWHENQRGRECDFGFRQALALPCLRGGVVYLIDTDLLRGMRTSESEGVESGAQDDDLLDSAFDGF